MTISIELGWFWKEPLVSTPRLDQYALIVFWRKLNHPNSLEIVITWCYRKPFYIVLPPCKVSNPTCLCTCRQLQLRSSLRSTGVRNLPGSLEGVLVWSPVSGLHLIPDLESLQQEVQATAELGLTSLTSKGQEFVAESKDLLGELVNSTGQIS